MKNPLDRLADFLARHDCYQHYRTRREAAFARGTVAGLLVALALRLLWLLVSLVVAPAVGFGHGVLLPFFGSATQCLLPGLLLGGVLAMREPRWMPIAGSLIAPMAGAFPDGTVEAVCSAWERECLWRPLDGVLKDGRAPKDSLGLPAGNDPIESIVAAENLEAAENSFAVTAWYAPCDPRNAVWFSPRRETFLNAEPGLDGFRSFFSPEAVRTRWDSLPAAAREFAALQKDELLERAHVYAASRREALDRLGDVAGTLPMLGVRRWATTPEEFAVGLLLHEAGHLRLAAWCGSSLRYALEGHGWESPLARELLAVQPVPVSLYSLVTPGEWFAEHYAAWRSYPETVTPAMGQLLQAVAFGEPLPVQP